MDAFGALILMALRQLAHPVQNYLFFEKSAPVSKNIARDRVGGQTLTLTAAPAHGVRSIEARDMDSSGLA
jgi:hypothetical protein